MNKKILISILSLAQPPYNKLEKAIRNTWGSIIDKDVEIIYYYGNSKEIKLVGDKLFLNHPEGLYNIGHKTLKMYEFILQNFKFDYLFRTNSSSYIDVEKLKLFISDKSLEKFYSGIIGDYAGIKFVSGSGYFLSRDLIKLVVDNKNKWNHTLIDDVALGDLLSKYNIPLYLGERIDLKTPTIDSIPSSYHYRVKCRKFLTGNASGDIKLLRKIHKLKNANKS